MINRNFTYQDNMREYGIAKGAEIKEEGQVLVSVMEDGFEKVKPSAGTEGEKVVGFSWSNAIVPGTAVDHKVEVAEDDYEAGTFTVTLENAIDGTIAVTIDGVAGSGSLSEGTFTVSEAVEKGDVVEFSYRKNLTVYEARALFGDKRVNLFDNNLELGSISVIRGNGDMWTDQYDTSADWSSATEAAAGANGLLVPAGAGKTTVGRIIGKPQGDKLFLGVSFNLA